MPGEYGDKQSITIYINKNLVERLESLAFDEGINRSKYIVSLIEERLEA
jgi:metal-responsive CopG/Arc/MetJ family transcriptional regulator